MNLEGNQASIREACDAGLLAGAVTMVWQHGNVLQVNEIGYRDVEAGLPMQRDTLFRIASMTKPVTVAAAMSLVDEGKLALRDVLGGAGWDIESLQPTTWRREIDGNEVEMAFWYVRAQRRPLT